MVNLIAVLAAGIVSMILGFIWYGPLFGKTWMKLSGFKKEDMGKMKTAAQKSYAIMFASSLVMAYVLAFLIETLAIQSNVLDGGWFNFYNSLFLTFSVWLGFVATVSLGSVLWENKPVKLYLLNNSYNLVNLLVMTIVIVMLP